MIVYWVPALTACTSGSIAAVGSLRVVLVHWASRISIRPRWQHVLPVSVTAIMAARPTGVPGHVCTP
jgi:hypothetical protein